MSGYLLDTNVISELAKAGRDPQVVSFLTEQNDLWLSVIVVHELEFGAQTTQDAQHRSRVIAFYRSFFDRHTSRILPVERSVADRGAQLRTEARRAGRVLHLPDALIAGTANVHNLILATRNVRDFADLGVDVVNPWESR